MDEIKEDESQKANEPLYLKSLTLKEVNCFKGENTFDFTDKKGKPAQWTVILGNNNTGKTTVLRALAGLEPVSGYYLNVSNEEGHLEKEIVIPSLADNKYLKRFFTFHLISSKLLTINNFTHLKSLSGQLFLPKYFCKEESGAWYVSRGINTEAFPNELNHFKLNAYGISRRPGKGALSDQQNDDAAITLFRDDVELLNVEEWLLQLDYSVEKGSDVAKQRLAKVKEILTAGILPDVPDFRFKTDDKLKNYVEFQTDFGWIRLDGLGYGYQATLTWLIDLVKRMFERYPESENPLREPAIVLVDEIDLHLHPEWQRKISGFLCNLFPNTQFIVTAHSPQVIQSAEDINVILLRKEDDHVVVRQEEITNFQGWAVEEILSELMGLDDRIYSDTYLKLFQKFDEALDNDDYKQAKEAHDALDKILPPGAINASLCSYRWPD